MRWKRFTISTTTAAIDFISDLLSELGIEGIEIEDNIPLTEAETKGMFIDVLPQLPQDDGTAFVSFYLEEGQAEQKDTSNLLSALRAGLEELKSFVDIGTAAIEESYTEDKDWINNWKEFFKPFTIDQILIKPLWEKIPPEHADKIMIEMDPGTAFGTGTHETTQLCIRSLARFIKPGDTVLDVGTGSGILSICALKLGAQKAVGTDLDEAAIKAAGENAQANAIPDDKINFYYGNLIDDPAVKDAVGEGIYDVIVANILAPVIIQLQAVIAPHLKTGGIFITSGILDVKEEEVKSAIAANPQLEVFEVKKQGEWISIAARKINR